VEHRDDAEPQVPAAVEPEPPDPRGPPAAHESDPREGRLGPGSEIVALQTIAAPKTSPGCATCSLSSRPILVIAAAIDDATADETLRDLDAMWRYYADDGLGGVLVLAPRMGTRLGTPDDPGAAIERALARARRLRLAIPVHVPARVDDGGNRVWDEDYAVATTPLALLVGDDERVAFSAAAPADWAALDRAIVDALGRTKSPVE
jgi:hypothetical protein